MNTTDRFVSEATVVDKVTFKYEAILKQALIELYLLTQN